VRAGSSTPVLQATLGWAGGDQGVHLHCGSDDIGDSEFVKPLHEEGQNAHGPIIEALENPPRGGISKSRQLRRATWKISRTAI
jgi:hypothetical protein